MKLVIDASIALAWCFDDESNEIAERVLRSLSSTEIVVPSHWFLEVGNGLLMAERRGRAQPADTARAAALLQGLGISVDEHTASNALGATASLARQYGLTLYDAAYLELVIREDLPIASLDEQLIAACKKCGVKMEH